jgi:hypothetical protein
MAPCEPVELSIRPHRPGQAAQVNDMSDFHDQARSAEATLRRAVTAGRRLERWTATRWTGGVQVDEQAALDTLTVCTCNSTYTLVVLQPATGDVLVRGGLHCPTFERAVLVGATAGGSLIKLRGIYRGLRMEILIRGRRVLTSPVISIVTAPAGSHPDGDPDAQEPDPALLDLGSLETDAIVT